MAFKRQRLETVARFGAAAMEGAATLAKWFYRTEDDTLAQVLAAEYFDSMADKQMKVGDVIEVLASDGLGMFKVTANDGEAITVKRIGYVSGQHLTVDADDTIVTGLSAVAGVVATLDDDPVAGCQHVTATIGNQAGAPAAGSVQIKSWKATAAGDTALIAATTFGKKVNWIAFGD